MSEARLLQHARSLFTSALRDCSVDGAYERKMQVVEEAGRTLLQVAGKTVDLTGVHHLRVVSAGKAGAEMLMGFLSRLPTKPDWEVKGVLIAHSRPVGLPEGIDFFAGGHPIPNQASFDGASAALTVVREAATLRNALCLFFISGGASAMMELPLAPEISLADTATFYQSLVHSGATIAEINCIRKHFSAIKGGRLALAGANTPSLTLLVSDVPPQHLDCLASGPTIPDPTTISECRGLLSRYSLEAALPPSIQNYFLSSSLRETPKPEELSSALGVLLDSDDLASSAARHASALGYHVVLDHACDDMAFDEAARYLLGRIRLLRMHHDRVCLISAGEVTVPVPALLQPGLTHLGGRNQHFALFCASLLTLADQEMVVLSAGSDGIDGNSLAAGGVISTSTIEREERLQEARQALQQFDSFTFLASRGATVVTGPTGNNLRDLRLLLVERRS